MISCAFLFLSSIFFTMLINLIVCLIIMALDVSAGILGIEAEIAQNKVTQLRVWIFECREPSLQAFKLALAAAILQAFAHVIANLLGGCVCISSTHRSEKASSNKQLAIAFLVFSWCTLAIGNMALIIGTMGNSKSRRFCGISHHRFLLIGAILCFAHCFFTVAYYVFATAAARETTNYPLAARV